MKEENVQVDKNLRRVRMRVEYKVPLNFIVTTFDWTFSHDIARDIFVI